MTVNDYLERLRFLFSENLVLAALDLVDRESGRPLITRSRAKPTGDRLKPIVIKYNTPWGHTQYQVLGSTSTYAVFLGVPKTKRKTADYCTCPAFTFSVLLSDSELMVSPLYTLHASIENLWSYKFSANTSLQSRSLPNC